MTLKIGSLCTGYGGLDMAVEAVLDARTAWVSDIDKGACKVLAHRFPGVPNLGDMTAIDWAQVEPVDVITGGTPCQDLSHAGKRAGIAPLSMAVQELPTPSCACAMSEASQTHCPAHGVDSLVAHERWGQYAAAIARWETVTREAPAPTELGAKGNPRLSPLFTEWMMGLPAGWITDVPGVTRNEALKLCGNGVVPQQAAAALRFLLPLISEQVAA